jgi:hypothetical protein
MMLYSANYNYIRKILIANSGRENESIARVILFMR